MKKFFCFLILFLCSLNAGQVTPIDSITLTTLPAVTVGNNSSYIAVGSTYAFVANSGSNTVTAINLNTFATTSLLSVTNPIEIAIGTTYAFVLGSNNPSQINFINQTTLANLPPITIGNNATAIAVGATYVFATSAVDNTVTVLDQNTLEVFTPIAVGPGPIDVAVGTNLAYVLNSDNTVTPIDLATLTAGAAIPIGGVNLTKIASFFDGTTDFAFVLDSGGNQVFPITGITLGAPISVGVHPADLGILQSGPDGVPYLIVANEGDGSFIALLLTFPFFAGSTIIIGGSPTNLAVGTNFMFFTDLLNNQVLISSSAFFEGQTPVAINSPRAIGVLGTSNAFVVSTGTSPIITISPPNNFSGFQDAVRSLFQTDLANVLSWQLPASGIPAFYKIFRDGSLQDLAGVVNGNVFTFVDHGRKKGIANTYFIVAVDSSGNVSEPASLTIQ